MCGNPASNKAMAAGHFLLVVLPLRALVCLAPPRKQGHSSSRSDHIDVDSSITVLLAQETTQARDVRPHGLTLAIAVSIL